MSFDLVVIDRKKRFKNQLQLKSWIHQLTKWENGADSNDYRCGSSRLQSFYYDIKNYFPPLNHAEADDMEKDCSESELTDYSFAKDAVYMAFAWSVADKAYVECRRIALKYGLAFLDLSNVGSIIYPDGNGFTLRGQIIENGVIKSEFLDLKKGSFFDFNIYKVVEICINVVFILALLFINKNQRWTTFQGIIGFIVLFVLAFALDYCIKAKNKKKTQAAISDFWNPNTLPQLESFQRVSYQQVENCPDVFLAYDDMGMTKFVHYVNCRLVEMCVVGDDSISQLAEDEFDDNILSLEDLFRVSEEDNMISNIGTISEHDFRVIENLSISGIQYENPSED